MQSKKFFSVIVMLLLVFVCFVNIVPAAADVPIDEEHFPDPVFRESVQCFDMVINFGNNDGILNEEEMLRITEINLSGVVLNENSDAHAASLKGIEYLTNLRELHIDNTDIDELDLSKNVELRILECQNRENLTKLDLSKNTELRKLNCWNCKNLTDLDVSNCKFLNELFCFGTKIKNLDLSNNTMLTTLYCGGYSTGFSPNITYYYLNSLNISKNKQLTELRIEDSAITELDLSNNINLVSAECYWTPELKHVDVRNCKKLQKLHLGYNILEELDVSNNTLLTSLSLIGRTNIGSFLVNPDEQGRLDTYRGIKTLYLKNAVNLRFLEVNQYELRELDLTNNVNLKEANLGVHALYANNYKVEDIHYYQNDYEEITGKAALVSINLSDYIKNISNVTITSNIESKSNWWECNAFCEVYSYDSSTGILLFFVPLRTYEEVSDVISTAYFGNYLHYEYDTHSPINVNDTNRSNRYISVYIIPTNDAETPTTPIPSTPAPSQDPINMKIEALERAGFGTDNIICDMTDDYYLNNAGIALDETMIARRAYSDYGKIGLTADGNSRLILRVQTDKPGYAYFRVDNIGATLEPLNNRKRKDTYSTSLRTSEEGELGYQASAVLTAPEQFPSGKTFPSDKFKVHVEFEADDGTKTEKDLELVIEAAPVVLIPGLLNDSAKTFGVYGKTGVIQSLKNSKFKEEHIAFCDYMNLRGVAQLDKDYNRVFEALKNIFDYYAQGGIVCTRADIVAHGLGGLMIRKFLEKTRTDSEDGNNWTVRSYKQGMVRRVITIATPHRGTPWADSPLAKSLLGILNSAVWDSLIYDQPIKNALLKPVYLLMNIFEGNNWATIIGEGMNDIMTTANRSYGYPSDIPMYAIYGNVKDRNNADTLIDSTTMLIDKRTGKNLAVFDVKTHIFDYLPKILDKISKNKDLFAAKFLRAAGTVYNVPEYVGLMMNAISSLLFASNKGHDMIVSVESAAGDFEGYCTGFINGDNYHWSICRQEDVGDKVADLLKGSVTKFKIFGSNNMTAANKAASTRTFNAASSNSTLKAAAESETENFAFIDCLNLQVWKNTSETVRFKLQSNNSVTQEIFCFIDTDDRSRFFKFPTSGENKNKFEVEFDVKDIFADMNLEILEIYCFSRNPNDTDGSSIYTSNIVTALADSEVTTNDVKVEENITPETGTKGNGNVIPEKIEINTEKINNMSSDELKKMFENKTDVALTGEIDDLSQVLKNLESVTTVKTLDLSKVEKLTDVKLDENSKIENLILTGNGSVKTVTIPGNTALKNLDISESKVTTVDIKGCTNIESVNMNNCELLEYLDVSETTITSLNAVNCKNLKTLKCSSCKITELNIQDCEQLESLDCSNNCLTKFYAGAFGNLNDLKCENQNVYGLKKTTHLNILDILFGRTINISAANDDEVNELANIKDIKAFDNNGNEIIVTYHNETGDVTFVSEPAQMKYNYITGFKDILMDVTVGMSNNQEEAELDKSGGGCSVNIGLILLLFVCWHLFALRLKL